MPALHRRGEGAHPVTPDVIVAGGGPAGTLAALTLARGGARVVLVDRDGFPRRKLCGDTLNPGGLALLRAVGLAGPIEAQGLPLEGMVVTGASGITIAGTYGAGVTGRAWSRRSLDAHLLDAAAAAGVDVRTRTVAQAHIVDGRGRVCGIRTRNDDARVRTLRARWTIAADGRRSALALALGLIRHPSRPRRWAIGTYADGVSGLGPFGEMHVRAGHYIGVAPAGGGLANLCLVTDRPHAMRDPARLFWDTVRRDPLLRDRCVRAAAVAPVVTLGPLAVDARAAGVPGLLLAGDAAGFVDPMTGDGLHLALRGGLLAAQTLLDPGLVGDDRMVIAGLERARRRALAGKLRFNRALRALVGRPLGVRLGAIGAAIAPALLRQVIARAGDVPAPAGHAA